jgi:hypothetical protein
MTAPSGRSASEVAERVEEFGLEISSILSILWKSSLV